MKRIYLDNNATTAIDPDVLAVLIEDLKLNPGNPSSTHFFGQNSRSKVIKARDLIASYLKVRPQELIFTSGGTEALNMVIRGLCSQSKGHIITTTIEHSAVYSTVQAMVQEGCSATFLQPGRAGAVTAEAVKAALRADTKLITIMAVNNETGVKTDLNQIARIAESHQIPFLVDGVALLGKEKFTIPSGVSAMAFSGHKLHAPKGIGCLYIHHRLRLKTQMTGGEQEFGKRGGTENVSGILALAEAIRQLDDLLPEASLRMHSLRDRLEKGLQEKLSGVTVNGQGERIVNVSNLSFSGVDGEALLMSLDHAGVAVSHGSACSAGALEPSRVLLNMGIPLTEAKSALRFSLSRFTTEAEIDATIDIVVQIVNRLRLYSS